MRQHVSFKAGPLGLAALFLFLSTTSAHAEAVATFQYLGDLPGGNFFSVASATSADGSVVVGYSVSANSGSIGNTEAFRWTSSTGMIGLGDIPGGTFNSKARGVSDNGLTLVGSGMRNSVDDEAVQWTNGTNIDGLGDLGGGPVRSTAYGVSADGNVVVGFGNGAFGEEAALWSQGTGWIGLGDLPGGGFRSGANAVSSDGSVVVGFGTSASGTEAFRWTSNAGMIGLGDLPGGVFGSSATATSSNGSVVVGYGHSASGLEAFRWTSSTGMVGLGDLPGGVFSSIARAVSPDGSIVVGEANGDFGSSAFLWTFDRGMRELTSILFEFGVGTSLPGYVVASDVAVSGNTVTVVGNAPSQSGTQAYRAQIPIVSASLADELLSLTPGLTSDTLSLDVSNTKLLYGEVGKYEFDFTTDGIYDLVLEVGDPLFYSYYNLGTESFDFPEVDIRTFFPAINAGGFGSLSFTTTIRMTHGNGTAINTTDATITVVPEVGTMGMLVSAGVFLFSVGAIRQRTKSFMK